MIIRPIALVLGCGTLGLAGCAAVPPVGPSFVALPGNGKTLQQFQYDDGSCRNYAAQTLNAAPAAAQAASNNGVATAAGGTVLGAAAGALLGAAAGNAAIGAAAGAGAGLLAGSAAGANQVSGTTAGLQFQYDSVYAQCMVAAGNSVPVSGGAGPGVGFAGPAYGYGPAFVGAGPVVVAPTVGFGWGGGWGWGGRWRRW